MVNKPSDIPEQIETPRLIMRRFKSSDTELFHEAIAESEENMTKWYNGTLAEKNVAKESIQSYVQDCITEWDDRSFIMFATFEKSTGRLIGAGSFHTLDWAVPKGRIGYLVRSSEEGKGYATEMSNALTRYAFDKLNLKRLEIRTATENKASAVIPKRLGYTFLCVFEKNKASNSGDIWDLEIHVRFDTLGLPSLDVTYS